MFAGVEDAQHNHIRPLNTVTDDIACLSEWNDQLP
jgi:hypothetical protein